MTDFGNFGKKKKKLSPKQWIVIAALLIVLIAIGLLLVRQLRPKAPTSVTANRLGCQDNGTMKVFGNRLLYYDGSALYCLSAAGAELWRFDIGSEAWYDCDDTHVVLWKGSSIYVLNSGGASSYSESLGEPVQFARLGKQYVGAVIGDLTTPRLVVKDLTGAHMDEESEAYSGLILMDLGFYGNEGRYMWTLATDIYGTTANHVLNTYEVGKTSAARVSLGANIPYAVVYDNGLLNVITTRKIRVFNDKHTENTSDAKLVYGWTYLCHESLRRSTAYLFAPEPQTNSSSYTIQELRLLQGSADKRYSLPKSCVGAALHSGKIYAFASDTLFVAQENSNVFESYPLPGNLEVTSLIGIMNNGKGVVACNQDLYVLTMP